VARNTVWFFQSVSPDVFGGPPNTAGQRPALPIPTELFRLSFIAFRFRLRARIIPAPDQSQCRSCVALPIRDSVGVLKTDAIRDLIQTTLLALSWTACGVVIFLYTTQPDWGCAVTILPPWGWIAPGLLLTLLGFQRARWCRAAFVGALWLVFGLVTSEVELMNLRLRPHLVGQVFLGVDHWREQRNVRRQQRIQMATVMKQLNTNSSLPVIVGGDFNAPAGDPIYRPLRSRLRDAFAVHGRGLGNTFFNQFPAVRIDQVWVSEQFVIRDMRVHPTINSDHRLVVTDLVLP
jgi:hypothetical protein